ncbi:hypothetical protein MLC52_03625 [Sulfurimonas sp. NW15]|uniref:hypothetical protein n=1 Tax=Sulfurimonas sp. NW15 TaxID=2922729 RepID=UPI003DAA4661
MKKSFVLASLLVLGATSAMAGMYVGIDFGVNSNTDKVTGASSGSWKNKYKDFSVKIGTGKDGDWKGQLRLSRISYNETIFDATHKTLIEFGGDTIKEFTLESVKNLYPYVKIGLGVGSMSVDGYSDSSISEVSFNAGVGVSYKALENVYLIAGVDYVGRKWQDVTIGAYTWSTTGSGVKPYIGVNYAF